MDFDALFAQVIALLQHEQRISYRVLKRRFALSDDDLADVKDELIYAKKLAVDEENRVLVWTGGTAPMALPTPAPSHPEPALPHTTDHEREPLSYTPKHLAEKILTSRSALEGERKQVTVLFCDLANSTPIAERIGPEAHAYAPESVLRTGAQRGASLRGDHQSIFGRWVYGIIWSTSRP